MPVSDLDRSTESTRVAWLDNLVSEFDDGTSAAFPFRSSPLAERGAETLIGAPSKRGD